MSTSGGTQDWFYHAPVKRSEHTAPIEYPAASQIPGLNSLAENIDDENGAKVGWIKDTDTKYIRLAKMGGRKDLLRHRENCAPKSEAKAYPRCEWFDYVENLSSPDSGPRPSYLPDYMVYEEFNPARQPDNMHFPDKPRKPPYSLCDNLSAFKRDGDAVTDKTIQLPEIDRQYKKGAFKVSKDTRRSKVHKREENQSGHHTGQNLSKEQVVSFSKLLSMGYQDEWLKQRQKEFMNQQRMQEDKKNKDSSANNNKITTEYREVICKDQKNEKTTSQSVPKIRHTKASEARKRRDSDDDNKELFKLNRFTKVGPKVNSHWQKTDDSYNQQFADVDI